MSKGVTQSLDENTRRYYLDVMGIQCWELIDSPQEQVNQNDVPLAEGNDRDVDVISYERIEESVQQCDRCQLHETRKQALAGRGSKSADLMFVVLAPSASDDESGIICGGEANALFSKMLAAIDIDIGDVFLTSLLKCSVPMKHTVSPKEIQSCNNYLKQQIQYIQPKLLVVLGETTVRCLLQKDLLIDDYRTKNDDMPPLIYGESDSIPLFVSYSPGELLLQPENKRKAWSDLQQLQKIISNI